MIFERQDYQQECIANIKIYTYEGSDKYIYIDTYSDINLDLDARFKERLNVVY